MTIIKAQWMEIMELCPLHTLHWNLTQGFVCSLGLFLPDYPKQSASLLKSTWNHLSWITEHMNTRITFLLYQGHPSILSLICPFIMNNYICLWKLYDSIWDTKTGLNEVLYGHNSTLTLNFLAFVDFCHNLNIFQT